jgi:3-oxoacyl-[acyl-carrier protein] reductase
MTDLSGHTTLVTGASHGIGRATAVTLAAHGARVLVQYRTGAAEAERVVEAIARHGGRAEAVYADLSAADGAHRLATAVRSRADRLDILVANAGSYKAASIEDMSVEDFDGLFAVNVRAP